MSEVLAVRDKLRDFFRKYDEITTPIFRFIASYVMFMSINSLYGYSDLFEKGIVVFLLSVICALVSSSVVVLVGGLVILANTFAVSLEVGILFALVFLLIYCMYMRMFTHCSWILALVPILYMLKLTYAIPIIVAIFAGPSGIVPVAFGGVLYYFSVYTKEVSKIIPNLTDDDKDFQAYAHILEGIAKNKELLLAIIVFAVVIMITHLIYKLSFDYSWYVAIGVGGISNIIFFMICGIMLDIDVEVGSLILGSLIGVVVSVAIQMCKSLADYSRKESVQFEDDEYYYYVKAIPKYNVSTKKKSVKNMTQEQNLEKKVKSARVSNNDNI